MEMESNLSLNQQQPMESCNEKIIKKNNYSGEKIGDYDSNQKNWNVHV